MTNPFNNHIRQIILLLIIVVIAVLLLKEFAVFLPGFLGAITFYILMRQSFFNLTQKRHWNKTWTAVLFILCGAILLGLPIYFSIDLLSTKFAAILANPTDLIIKAKVVEQHFADFSGIHLLSDENLMVIQKKATTIIPTIINSTAILLSNFAIMFFLLYYFLKSGRELEIFLFRHIPLKPHNLHLLGHETLGMVRANAIGIPVLAITQGLIAALGYWIFDVKDFVLWGFLTGIFSMVPVVGTAIIWVPIVAYMVAIDQNSQALGLLIYALVLITHIDYVVRLTLLKKYIDVHPLVTIFGVIVGIGLFGFWGVIFGPLLISYFLILVKIYMNEFYIDPEPSGNN